MMNKANIWLAVDEERRRQDKLHPYFPILDGEKLSILLEECGEVAKALNECDKENLKDELIQVASVCLRWLESIEEDKEFDNLRYEHFKIHKTCPCDICDGQCIPNIYEGGNK